MPLLRPALLNALGLLAVVGLPSTFRAQQRGALTVEVRSAETGKVLVGAVVAVPSLGQRLSVTGRAVRLWGLAVGPLALQIRAIGFAPLDTTVLVPVAGRRADSALVVRLVPQPYEVEELVVIACQGFGAEHLDPAARAELRRLLLVQLEAYAARFRGFVAVNPFTVRYRYSTTWHNTPQAKGEMYRGLPQPRIRHVTQKYEYERRSSYRRGKVLGRINPTSGLDRHALQLPLLHDLLTSAFEGEHPWVYDGCAEYEGRKLHKLSFHPVDSLTGPDVQGSLYVDMETQLPALLDLRVANHPKFDGGCEDAPDDPTTVGCYSFYRTRVEQRWFYGELTPGLVIEERGELIDWHNDFRIERTEIQGLEITYRTPKPDAPSR